MVTVYYSNIKPEAKMFKMAEAIVYVGETSWYKKQKSRGIRDYL
jgi:hypothetical protein